jgi:K+/H+ antiporter YhaU regulatory subunit KhtT
MKNDTVNFLLIMIAYFSIGLLVSQAYVQNQRLKTMNDSINRLIMIELITEEQFNLLHDEVKDLRKKSRTGLTIADTMVY